jgi:O-acetylserine/cysteine efflux transporter
VVWSSVAAVPPLLLLSFFNEPAALADLPNLPAHDLWQLSWVTLVLALPTTVFAFALWVWLLRTYQAAVVTPFALLVPVFGFAGAAVFLGERWSIGVAVGAFCVLAGLAINIWGGRWEPRRPADP